VQVSRILFYGVSADAEPLTDTHVHFWDRSIEGLRWAWLEPGFTHPRLGRLPEIASDKYTAPEFRRDTAGCDLAKVVHIQAAQAPDPIVETAWLQEMSRTDGWPDAVVGYCNLASPDAGEVVERHLEFPIFRGVRDLPAGERLGTPEVIRGFAAVASFGVPIEAMTSWPNYDHVIALASAHPDITVVLGHAGLPVARDAEYFEHWSAGIRRLAELPNIVCKISALASGSDPWWTIDSIRPWVLGCLETFGPDRCMLGTNWPIDSLFGDYPKLVGAYREITAGLSPTELRNLFSGTAATVYHLAEVDDKGH
jgi:predicted TIM-barrel fold metal-dependent hydrolase